MRKSAFVTFAILVIANVSASSKKVRQSENLENSDEFEEGTKTIKSTVKPWEDCPAGQTRYCDYDCHMLTCENYSELIIDWAECFFEKAHYNRLSSRRCDDGTFSSCMCISGTVWDGANNRCVKRKDCGKVDKMGDETTTEKATSKQENEISTHFDDLLSSNAQNSKEAITTEGVTPEELLTEEVTTAEEELITGNGIVGDNSGETMTEEFVTEGIKSEEAKTEEEELDEMTTIVGITKAFIDENSEEATLKKVVTEKVKETTTEEGKTPEDKFGKMTTIIDDLSSTAANEHLEEATAKEFITPHIDEETIKPDEEITTNTFDMKTRPSLTKKLSKNKYFKVDISSKETIYIPKYRYNKNKTTPAPTTTEYVPITITTNKIDYSTAEPDDKLSATTETSSAKDSTSVPPPVQFNKTKKKFMIINVNSVESIYIPKFSFVKKKSTTKKKEEDVTEMIATTKSLDQGSTENSGSVKEEFTSQSLEGSSTKYPKSDLAVTKFIKQSKKNFLITQLGKYELIVVPPIKSLLNETDNEIINTPDIYYETKVRDDEIIYVPRFRNKEATDDLVTEKLSVEESTTTEIDNERQTTIDTPEEYYETKFRDGEIIYVPRFINKEATDDLVTEKLSVEESTTTETDNETINPDEEYYETELKDDEIIYVPSFRSYEPTEDMLTEKLSVEESTTTETDNETINPEEEYYTTIFRDGEIIYVPRFINKEATDDLVTEKLSVEESTTTETDNETINPDEEYYETKLKDDEIIYVPSFRSYEPTEDMLTEKLSVEESTTTETDNETINPEEEYYKTIFRDGEIIYVPRFINKEATDDLVTEKLSVEESTTTETDNETINPDEEYYETKLKDDEIIYVPSFRSYEPTEDMLTEKLSVEESTTTETDNETINPEEEYYKTIFRNGEIIYVPRFINKEATDDLVTEKLSVEESTTTETDNETINPDEEYYETKLKDDEIIYVPSFRSYEPTEDMLTEKLSVEESTTTETDNETINPEEEYYTTIFRDGEIIYVPRFINKEATDDLVTEKLSVEESTTTETDNETINPDEEYYETELKDDEIIYVPSFRSYEPTEDMLTEKLSVEESTTTETDNETINPEEEYYTTIFRDGEIIYVPRFINKEATDDLVTEKLSVEESTTTETDNETINPDEEYYETKLKDDEIIYVPSFRSYEPTEDMLTEKLSVEESTTTETDNETINPEEEYYKTIFRDGEIIYVPRFINKEATDDLVTEKLSVEESTTTETDNETINPDEEYYETKLKDDEIIYVPSFRSYEPTEDMLTEKLSVEESTTTETDNETINPEEEYYTTIFRDGEIIYVPRFINKEATDDLVTEKLSVEESTTTETDNETINPDEEYYETKLKDDEIIYVPSFRSYEPTEDMLTEKLSVEESTTTETDNETINPEEEYYKTIFRDGEIIYVPRFINKEATDDLVTEKLSVEESTTTETDNETINPDEEYYETKLKDDEIIYVPSFRSYEPTEDMLTEKLSVEESTTTETDNETINPEEEYYKTIFRNGEIIYVPRFINKEATDDLVTEKLSVEESTTTETDNETINPDEEYYETKLKDDEIIYVPSFRSYEPTEDMLTEKLSVEESTTTETDNETINPEEEYYKTIFRDGEIIYVPRFINKEATDDLVTEKLSVEESTTTETNRETIIPTEDPKEDDTVTDKCDCSSRIDRVRPTYPREDTLVTTLSSLQVIHSNVVYSTICVLVKD